MKLGFIGCGNMAKAMMGGIISSEILKADEIIASDAYAAGLEKAKAELGINVTASNTEVAGNSEVVVLSVKPQFYATVINEIKDVIAENTIIVTIAPGQTLARLHEQFGKDVKIVRCMPNTPAMVTEGMTAAVPNEFVTKEEIEYVCSLLDGFGKSAIVSEYMMDAVVSVSGSSPAYVYMFIEALADGAVHDGMPRDLAYKFAAQAVYGSAKMVLETGMHPGVLKDMVCSPAGTTIEAVRVLEEKGFRSSVLEAMMACTKKQVACNMSTFRLKPEIEVFEKVDGYLSTYSFTEEDFILISKAVHDAFFKDKLGKAKVFFRSNYGSGEPSSSMVNALIQDFMDSGCTRITAIGGGSVIDMAKVLLVARDADVDALFTNPVNLKRRYQLTAIPTTCGAGSEVSNISIVELESLKTKLGLAKDEIFPDQCILIPELMQGISTFSFITSAIDGMIHGIESYLSKRSNVYSRMFQEKCITMYLEGFKALQNGADKESLFTPFLIASNMAGIAFSNTGTGAVHAISYPLSGTYHVTHGLANSIFLTEVLKTYQRLDNRSELNELFELMAKPLQCEASQVIEELENLLKAVIEIPGLQSLGMKEEEIVSFAKSVIELQQRLLTNGYVPLSQSDIENIYRNLW